MLLDFLSVHAKIVLDYGRSRHSKNRQNMKILVTGGTGFIGSNVTKALVEQGHEVTVIGRTGECRVEGARFLQMPLDCLDMEVIGQQHVCVHQAANNDTTDMDAVGMNQANVYGPMNLFTRLAEYGCRKFVYASSTAVYGDAPAPYFEDKTPLQAMNPYGKSKVLFDEFAMDFAAETGLDVVGLRYCNVYGHNEHHKGKRASMVFQIWQGMKEGRAPRLFADGEQKRDWCFIKDVVAANLAALEYKGYNIFNVGSGKATSFNEIVRLLNQELGTSFVPEYIDNPYQAAYQNFTECNLDKSRERLNWQPVYDLAFGIQEMILLSR